MAIFKALRRLFRCRQRHLPSKRDPGDPAFKHTSSASNFIHDLSALEKLPTEILQNISIYLPLSATAVLALCSHTLLRVLGTQHWDQLREPKRSDDRAIFLALLDSEFPELILCAQCAKLHRPYPNGADDNRPLARDCERGVACNPRSFTRVVRFNNVQAAMKKHRQGRDVTEALRDLSYAVVHMYPLGKEHPTSVMNASARPCIVDGEMLFRIQCRVFVHAGAPFPDLVTWSACAHQGLYVRDDHVGLTPLAEMLTCRIGHLATSEGACARCEGLRQCRACDTEYRMDHKVWPGEGTSLVVTAWLNVGSGRSLADPKWAQYIDIGFNISVYVARNVAEVGAVQRAFDMQHPFSIEQSLVPDFVPWLKAMKPIKAV